MNEFSKVGVLMKFEKNTMKNNVLKSFVPLLGSFPYTSRTTT